MLSLAAQLARLYPVALEGLRPLVKLTAEGLALVLPIITVINRAFDPIESETQASSAVNVEEFTAFGEFWIATFDQTDLPAPAELIDVIKVTKTVWHQPMGDSVGESQTQDTQSMRARPSEEPASFEMQTLVAPRAGQRPRSSRGALPLLSALTSQTADTLSLQPHPSPPPPTRRPKRIRAVEATRPTSQLPARFGRLLLPPRPVHTFLPLPLHLFALHPSPPPPSAPLPRCPRARACLRRRRGRSPLSGRASLSPTARCWLRVRYRLVPRLRARRLPRNEVSSGRRRRDWNGRADERYLPGPSPELGRSSSPKKKSKPPSVVSDSDSDDALVISAAPRSSQASAGQGSALALALLSLGALLTPRCL